MDGFPFLKTSYHKILSNEFMCGFPILEHLRNPSGRHRTRAAPKIRTHARNFDPSNFTVNLSNDLIFLPPGEHVSAIDIDREVKASFCSARMDSNDRLKLTWDLRVVEDGAGEDAADVPDAALGRQPHRHRLPVGVALQRHLQLPLDGRRTGGGGGRLALLVLLSAVIVTVHHRHVEELA